MNFQTKPKEALFDGIMESLKGKIVFLAGATGGIGSAAARLLHQSGARLHLCGRNTEKLERLAQQLGLSSQQVHLFDMHELADVSAIARQIIELEGRVDIFINALGMGILKPAEQLTLQQFQEVIQVNLVGAFALLQAFLPYMKKEGRGLVIHLPGVLGKVPMAGAAAYAASRYGLMGMLQSVREEVKRTNIRFTNVILGGVDTPFWDSIDMRVQREKMITAEDAARAIWFLCQQPESGVVSELVLQPFNHQAI